MTAPGGTGEPGSIVTFYSYKGGTGRSMALANLACLAAREVSPGRVLMIDWDLEAPGLNRYFPESEQPENANRPGLIDYFVRLTELLTPETYEKLAGRDGAQVLESLIPLDDYIAHDVGLSLDLMKAGRMDRDYPDRIASFDWVGLFRKYYRVYRAFRDQLSSRYSWCFVDSRTGLSDTSGICTMLMPEKLVAVFTPNRQSLDGVINLASRAIEYRRSSDDTRPLSVFPLPSRIVTEEHKFLQEAQERYRKVFEECLQGGYELKSCNLASYFEEVAIPHKGFYGFNEMVALRDDPSATDVLSINRAYERFWRRLATLDAPWDSMPDAAEAPPPPQVKAPEPASGSGFLSDAGFEHDVYVSYAHVDNVALGGDAEGFVTRLQQDLRRRLEQYLGTSVQVWRDVKLLGGDDFSGTTETVLAKSATLVVICSPSYLASAWCRKELEVFLQTAKEPGVPAGSRSRLFRVDKTPVGVDRLPPEMASLLGYAFYRLDDAGRAREFFIDDQNRASDYVTRLDDLAHDISKTLTEMRDPQAESAKGVSIPGRTVYLAETASDVAPERDQLSRELMARGHQVLPAQALPLTSGDYARAVREEMARADLSVHLVGARRGIVPEAEERPIVELQCEIAMQISKRCLVWIAPGSGKVPVQETVEQSNNPGAEIVNANFQDFKGVVVDRLAGLSHAAQSAVGVLPQIYLMHEEDDWEAAKILARYLESKGVEVAHPLFSATPSEIRRDRTETLQTCDAAVIVWGSATEAWLRAMIRELRKASNLGGRKSLPYAIYLTPPLDDAKTEFSMQGSLVIRGSSLSDLDPLIAQLDRRVTT